MRLVRLYYDLKPFIPARLRLAVRRSVALRLLQRSRDVWPISRTAAKPPAGWRGWPDGKRFAVVLTHDVEGPEGLAECLRVADLEESAGFRSSFNFVPEGGYSTPESLRRELVCRGFEIGVHDLRHDGKLYRSRGEFKEHARSINEYVKAWGAKGFRSGFMHHRLDWLHDLEIEYDMSTFDTDPFEPEPDGVDTIFPFWVSGESGRGYVELPYTLPQDSTLFFLLKFPDISVWKQKLDWVAQKGGMALLNVHPDYVSAGSKVGLMKYPISLYAELLDYIQTKYRGEYWHARPREVAQFGRSFFSTPQSEMSAGMVESAA